MVLLGVTSGEWVDDCTGGHFKIVGWWFYWWSLQESGLVVLLVVTWRKGVGGRGAEPALEFRAINRGSNPLKENAQRSWRCMGEVRTWK